MARHCTVNYLPPGRPGRTPLARLRRNACLLELARHVRARELDRGTRVDVVFTSPLDAVPDAFVAELRARGVAVHDGRAAYEEQLARFPRLVERAGGPERAFTFAFLRWLVVEALFPGEHVLCYDGDVLPNVPLAALAEAFAGRTCTATSTCFASIADPGWFAAWAGGLRELDRDPDAFVERRFAALARRGCDWWTSPEEYLAKVLVEAGELPQDGLGAGFPYLVVPQPHLLPRLYAFTRPVDGPGELQTPIRYERRDGVDTLDGTPVAFWHLQKPFASLLGAVSHLERRGELAAAGRVYPPTYYRYAPTHGQQVRTDPYAALRSYPLPPPSWEAERLRLVAARRAAADADPDGSPFSFASIWRRFFADGDLSVVFAERTWPRPGVWAGR